MFKKAVKGSRPFRIALDGPSGSGKTWTALMIMHELTGGNFCVIDTERDSASLYADRFPFDSFSPEDHNPKTYVRAIKAAENAGYKGVVIDSLSHAWMGRDGALEQVDKAAKRSQSGNTFTAWRDVTPLHNELVDTIVNCKIHVIATMRSKMEYVLESVTRNGKTTQQPRKIGLAPIQRDGLEYEFDLIADMDLDHNLIVSKTRLDSLDGLVINKPDKEFVDKLTEWLATTVKVSAASISDSTQEQPAQSTSEQATKEPSQDPKPAHSAASDPAEDEQLLSESDWTAIIEAGKANGWSRVQIYKYAGRKFSVNVAKISEEMMKFQGRELYKHISNNKPEAQ